MPSSFDSRDLVSVQVVAPYIMTDSTVVRKKLRLSSLERSYFQTTSILFKAAQALAMRIFTSCFVEFISLPRYVKDSTALIVSPEVVCMVPCWPKLMCSVLDALTYSPTSLAAFSSWCRSVSAFEMVSDVTARSSA